MIEQPPGMLDERDTILRKMSELVKLGVTNYPTGKCK